MKTRASSVGNMELVSFALRYTFREFCSNHLSVRVIQNIFYGYGIEPKVISLDDQPELTGARRITVETYYASIDWSSRQGVQKFLSVLNFVLSESLGSVAEEPKNRLRELCIKDGFRVEDNTVSFHDQHGVKGSVK